MADYQIRVSNTVQKKLDKLSDPVAFKLIEAITLLAINPLPVGCKKLKGQDGYRIRVGDYRIIYLVKHRELIILILDIGHRKDIYK